MQPSPAPFYRGDNLGAEVRNYLLSDHPGSWLHRLTHRLQTPLETQGKACITADLSLGRKSSHRQSLSPSQLNPKDTLTKIQSRIKKKSISRLESHVSLVSRVKAPPTWEGSLCETRCPVVSELQRTQCSRNTTPQEENPATLCRANEVAGISALDLNEPMVSQWLKQEARYTAGYHRGSALPLSRRQLRPVLS